MDAPEFQVTVESEVYYIGNQHPTRRCGQPEFGSTCKCLPFILHKPADRWHVGRRPGSAEAAAHQGSPVFLWAVIGYESGLSIYLMSSPTPVAAAPGALPQRQARHLPARRRPGVGYSRMFLLEYKVEFEV